MKLRGIVRAALLMAAVWLVGVSGCSKKPTPESVSTATDTVAVAVDTQAVAVDTLPITYDTLTDERDGQKYRTVVIGGTKWTAQNLNYQTDSGSWCYNDSLSYCDKYGRLYDWDAAMKACPAGYHLPSGEEWDSLGQTVGGERMLGNYGRTDWLGAGKKLKAKSGWNQNGNGINNYGFSALPSGYRDYTGKFRYVGDGGAWWTVSRYWDAEDDAYFRGMDYDHDNLNEADRYNSFGFSVRCVADAK